MKTAVGRTLRTSSRRPTAASGQIPRPIRLSRDCVCLAPISSVRYVGKPHAWRGATVAGTSSASTQLRATTAQRATCRASRGQPGNNHYRRRDARRFRWTSQGQPVASLRGPRFVRRPHAWPGEIMAGVHAGECELGRRLRSAVLRSIGARVSCTGRARRTVLIVEHGQRAGGRGWDQVKETPWAPPGSKGVTARRSVYGYFRINWRGEGELLKEPTIVSKKRLRNDRIRPDKFSLENSSDGSIEIQRTFI